MIGQPTVVLLHGLLGFVHLFGLDYFRGVPRLLAEGGFRVLTPSLPKVASIQVRAKALAGLLERQPGPLHLIGHSMGGLDARYYITHLGGYDKVKSLTTLCTPHRGSELAAAVCRWPLLGHVPALRDLTPAALWQFNAETPDHPDVRYFSYAAARPVCEIPWQLRPLAARLAAKEGAMDALVSVSSAHWSGYRACHPADHFEMVGQNYWFSARPRQTFDHLKVYDEIASSLLRLDDHVDA